jgi:endonuclease/exonuclease/phosphatase family metal-dependent hydrolase
MAARYYDLQIVNVYAPFGAEKRRQREHFYNTDIITLLTKPSDNLIIAGDFNCVINQEKCTGHANINRAFTYMLKALKMTDAWDKTTGKKAFTHYTTHGASRLDRIYLSLTLLNQRKGIETIVNAFTDHLAVVLHTAIPTQHATRWRGLWRMNVSCLADIHF